MSTGRISRIFQQIRDVVRSKELVGVDKHGNKYYRWYETSGTQRRERREVNASSAAYLYDPKTITGEWRMWLHKTRKDPPTEEELAQSEAKAAALRQKVQVLEEREKMRRFQMQSMGAAGSTSDASVEAFLQGMAQQGFNPGKRADEGSKSAQ